MITFFRKNWKFLLFVLISGLTGGYSTGLYFYDNLSNTLLQQLQEQNITKEIYAFIASIQYGTIYGTALAAIGIVISKKVNLWKKIKFNKKAIKQTSLITIIAALIIFPGDKLIFGTLDNWVNEQYILSPSWPKLVSGLLLGGVIEEVIMRLFFMSLFVFIISKIFYKNRKGIPVIIYIIANIMSALLFAAGHIPSTMAMTKLTPLLIFRCFLFNGGIGLCFGYLYRKYGIGYSMISHGFTHLISDVLMYIII